MRRYIPAMVISLVIAFTFISSSNASTVTFRTGSNITQADREKVEKAKQANSNVVKNSDGSITEFHRISKHLGNAGNMVIAETRKAGDEVDIALVKVSGAAASVWAKSLSGIRSEYDNVLSYLMSTEKPKKNSNNLGTGTVRTNSGL